MRTAVALRDDSARRLREAGALPSAITRGHVDLLLDQLGNLVEYRAISSGAVALTAAEAEAERQLREKATTQEATLPLDALREAFGLDGFDCEVLVLCAAVELDIEYERIVAYLHDDVARRAVSVELAATLTASSLHERIARRAALGPYGRLRRLGLISGTARDSGLRDELRLSPACVEVLFGTPADLGILFRDPAEVALARPPVAPCDTELLARLADSLTADRVDVVAIWGPRQMTRAVLAELAARTGIRVRRFALADAAGSIHAAAALGTALWIDADAQDALTDELAMLCRDTRVTLFLSGVEPWRPSELLAARRYVEVPLVPPDQRGREVMWSAALPEAAPDAIERVATAFRFDPIEVRAAAETARSLAALHTNGHVVTPAETLGAACLTVARKHGERHTTLVTPRRGAEDLVLPPELHARVLDLVHYFQALPRVMDEWGFSRRVSGGGLKALFTGESGTGKTLAAEVVAKELGLPMLKVDLARVVSKWIGETEKNLDLVFNEARDSHAVLFFDEAEALFGARGDVRHGTDRYANLEVSYLLQRFEDHGGVVILASNLRDKIDQAFMRRFHVVVGFPRPAEKERRRIWQRVFTSGVPLAQDLDLPSLAKLDLTGAGIVGAAQVAALLAAREGTSVSMRHVVRGLVRQYQRESRVLSAHELGPHAVHMAV
ncbi:MAG TPA: ATP-binding protein [Kofleriaceae bacterium]|nr:ATP-binding protein [Kofleriaceae bacterium]